MEELNSIQPQNIVVSDISAGEFIYGAFNRVELQRIKRTLSAVQVVHVNEAISKKGVELLEAFSLSHNLSLPDAFIAATALYYDIPIYTLNIKDFRFIPDLQLYS